MKARVLRLCLAAAIVAAVAFGLAHGEAAELLEGEFDRIDLGRRLIEPARMPSLRELREAVRRSETVPVLMFKLLGNDKNHHLPVWNGDGQRLALQRSEVDVQSSRLLMYASMGLTEPALVTDEGDAYDYMFRWTVNSPASFSFVRLRGGSPNTRVFVAGQDGKPKSKLSREGRYGYPAVYARTDGIWRLVYQESGQVVHQAWNAQGPVEDPVALVHGTAPCWSRDGTRLLAIRQRPGRESDPRFDAVVWNLRTEKETALSAGAEGAVRSPVWSPDERFAAFYVRETGEGKPWRVRVCPADGAGDGQTIPAPVVVNMTFESACPAWEPSSRRVWFFSEEQHQEAYYPIVAADARSGQLAVIHYPNRCTNPSDLAINPTTAIPEVAFVGHDGLPQDLFILFMNHY